MEAEADGAILPFSFYCRNARLCLKKAIAARKFQLPVQELSHLRKFLKLVSVVLPCHPLFLDPKHQKACEELQRHLDGTRQRVKELEQASASSADEPPRALECPRAQPRTPPACPLRQSSRPRSPVKTAALHRPETSITPRIHGRVRPKRRLDSPAASGSCASTGCKKKIVGSWDFLSNLHQRYPYAFSRKHRPTSTIRKSTPITTKPCWESPDGRACAGESLKSAASCRLSGEVSPFRSRSMREMPRVGALSLLTSESPGKSVEPGAMGRKCCEREREHGVSSCATFKEKAPSPPHVSPPTRQCDLGSTDSVRTIVQGTTTLDLPPSPAPPGRHLEKRPRSKSPQPDCWPNSLRQHKDRAEETCFPMPVVTPKTLLAKSPPSLSEPIMDPVSTKANGVPRREETPPKSRTFRFSKKTRVEPSSGWLACTGLRRPPRDNEAKTRLGEDSHDDDSSVEAHGLCGSISSTDCRQQPRPTRPVAASRSCTKEDDDGISVQAEQLQCGQQNIRVREDCERLRAELRSLRAEVHDPEATHGPQQPTDTEDTPPVDGAHSGACGRGAGGVRECDASTGVCNEDPVLEEDAASCTQVENEAGPALQSTSAQKLAAQREKLMDLLHRTRSIEKGRTKEQRPRKGCKLVNPGGKGRRIQKAANCCLNGKDSWSPSTSSSSSAYESSAPEQSASLSSVSLCHYAQSLNKPKGHTTCVNEHTHPEPRFTRPANSSPLQSTPGRGSQLKDSEIPLTETTPHPELSSPCTSSSSSPILIPTSYHSGADCHRDGCESAKSCKAGLSDSSTACSSRAHDTPVREQKIDAVLGRCGLVAASQGRSAGSPVKGGKKIVLPKRERGAAGHNSCRTKTTLEDLESCVQQEQGCCKNETNPKPHKLPPPSCFFIDMSDKVRNSSEDNSWCRVQEELKKTFIKKTNDIPSALEAHNENSEFLGNRLVTFVSQKLQSVQNELYEKKLSSLNRLVGELRGCVEGFRIRIDVEGEGWRGRVVGLEKELECLKDETEEELVDIKSRLLRDLKAKMDKIVADKVESDDCCRETLMEEIRCFKTEMGCFVRDASKKVFVSEVQKLLTDHHAEVGETRTDIKKELECLLEDKLEKAIYEALENPNGYFRKHLHHIRRVAAEAKLESEGLKKLEEALRAESKHIRKVVNRLEKDDMKRKLELEEFRRIVDEIDCGPKSGGSKRDASREKLIMERVESLSQMYLGGLEEVRSDLYSVKRSCRDRVNAIEAQWSDFQKQQELLDKGETSTHCSGQLGKYMLELDRFRDDLDEMKESIKGRSSSMMCDLDSNNACLQRLVETERGYVRGLLERESSLIRGQVIDICEANKNEVAGILKAEVQKRVLGMKDKTDCMASALRTDADSLQRNLLEVQEGSEAVAAALKRAERDRDKASDAAVEACQAASRASEVLEQVMGSFSNEMASARRKTVELQEGLISEARRASADVQQQRELAVAAVAEARISSEKVGTILQEVVGTFSTEMGQAKRKTLMLQENLEKEYLRAKGVAKEMESTSAKAGKTISDFTCEMECTRRKSLQLQEELERDIASILESEKRKLFVTPEEPTCSRAPKPDQELEAVKDELRQLAYRVDGLADGHVQRACGDPPPHVGAPDPATREESLRLCVLEKKTVDACTGQAGIGDGVSLRLEHIEKRGGTCETSGRHEVLSIQHKGGGISVSVPFRLDGDRGDSSHTELLQGDSMMGGYHRLDSADTCAAGSSLDSRISNLESRLENVASATFSNLRLLDGKVEHVSVGVQAALEGAACAENKCAALGVELVKVFRILARRPGSAASPGADSYDHPRYNDCHVQDQATSAHVPVRQGNMRKGCPVHDPEVNDASWPSMHQGSDCQLMQPTKDTGPPNPRGDSQRTKIKLDGGRIQVNVTSHHRHNKRPAPGSDMIVVQ